MCGQPNNGAAMPGIQRLLAAPPCTILRLLEGKDCKHGECLAASRPRTNTLQDQQLEVGQRFSEESRVVERAPGHRLYLHPKVGIVLGRCPKRKDKMVRFNRGELAGGNGRQGFGAYGVVPETAPRTGAVGVAGSGG